MVWSENTIEKYCRHRPPPPAYPAMGGLSSPSHSYGPEGRAKPCLRHEIQSPSSKAMTVHESTHWPKTCSYLSRPRRKCAKAYSSTLRSQHLRMSVPNLWLITETSFGQPSSCPRPGACKASPQVPLVPHTAKLPTRCSGTLYLIQEVKVQKAHLDISNKYRNILWK